MKKQTKSKTEEFLEKSDLTEKNKVFCREYTIDWNGSRAYKVAYPGVTDHSARTLAGELLAKPEIQKYIELIQKDLEKIAGISRQRVISEHMKIAFTSIAQLHETWIKRKEFEALTDDQKACIAEIDTKVRREWEYNPDTEKKEPIKVEYVRIKLFDKQKALDSIAKIMGYDAPLKAEIINNSPARTLTKEEISEFIRKWEDEH